MISGCSSGGKSSLLKELAARDFAIVREPGRRVVQKELLGDGRRLPWINMIAFAQAVLELALDDHHQAKDKDGVVFFDRGIVDAAAVLADLAADLVASAHLKKRYYNQIVFLAPPWPEIFVQDEERRHSYGDAVIEYERLLHHYSAAGYSTHILPKTNIRERADFVMGILSLT